MHNFRMKSARVQVLRKRPSHALAQSGLLALVTMHAGQQPDRELRRAPRINLGMGQCPICAKSFRLDVLSEHADLCASRIEAKRPAAPRGPTAGRGRGSGERKRAGVAASSGSDAKRPATAAARRWLSDAPIFTIESVLIDEFEFRCQAFSVQGVARGAPAPSVRLTMAAAGAPSDRTSEAVGSTGGNGGKGGAREGVVAREGGTREGGTTAKERLGPFVRGRPSGPVAGTAVDGAAAAATATAAAAPPAALLSRAALEEANLEKEASAFLEELRTTFAAPEAVRQEYLFMAMLIAFEDGALDTIEVMEQAAQLLDGHPALLRSFNRLLPEGFRIETLQPELCAYHACYGPEPLSPALAESLAHGFLRRVLRRFANDPGTLLELHAILTSATSPEPTAPSATPEPAVTKMATLKALSTPAVPSPWGAALYGRLAPLFATEPALRQEFFQFVPPSCHPNHHVHVTSRVAVAGGPASSDEG